MEIKLTKKIIIPILIVIVLAGIAGVLSAQELNIKQQQDIEKNLNEQSQLNNKAIQRQLEQVINSN